MIWSVRTPQNQKSSFLPILLQAKQNVTHTAVFLGHQLQTDLQPKARFGRGLKNMSCLRDITHFCPAVCFLELLNGNFMSPSTKHSRWKGGFIIPEGMGVNKLESTQPQAWPVTRASLSSDRGGKKKKQHPPFKLMASGKKTGDEGTGSNKIWSAVTFLIYMRLLLLLKNYVALFFAALVNPCNKVSSIFALSSLMDQNDSFAKLH